MNTLQRLLFFLLAVSAPFCVSQTGNVAAAQDRTILLASNGAAVDTPSSVISVTHPLIVKPTIPAQPSAKPYVSEHQRQAFYSLVAVEHGAALLDAWSTRDVLRQGGRELDPIVRPFAHSPALYPALQVAPFGVDYLANKLMRSNHRVLRSLWWVPQLVTAAGSTYCGVSNLGNRR